MAKKRVKKSVSSSGLASKEHLLGSWSFLVGIVLAILLGLGFTGPYRATMLWVVFLLGIIVGLLNITHDEVSAFLTSGTVLVLVSFLGVQVGIFDGVTPIISNVLKGILTLFVPATIIVALKGVFVLARK
jgi:hypothetical protein